MKLQLIIDSAEITGPFLRLGVFQAADRPDRLEAALPFDRGRNAADAARWTPGAGVAAIVSGRRLFSGVIDRVRESIDAESGRTLSVVAYASYHRRRATLARERYYQVTDSEAAERIASALDLTAVVERTHRVHPLLERDGDPLRFLRRRARECGFQLAVHEERLYFSRKLPPLGDALDVAVGRELISFAVEHRTQARGGALQAVGDARWRPLVPFEVKGLDGRGAGRYRSVRAIHRLDSDGYSTRVEFVEDGLDFSLWRDLDTGGEGHDLEE